MPRHTSVSLRMPIRSPSALTAVMLAALALPASPDAQSDTTVRESRNPEALCVLSLSYRDEIGDVFAESVMAEFSEILSREGALSVTARAVMQETLRDKGLEEACGDTPCAVAAGRALGVRNVIYGTVQKQQHVVQLSLFLVDVATASVVKEFRKTLSGDEEQLSKVLTYMAKLVVAHLAPAKFTSTTQAQTPLRYGAQRAKLGIETEPSGAGVSIDGRKVGVTPYTNDTLLPDNYTVSVAMDGYLPFSKTLYLPGGADKKMRIKLAPRLAMITIQTEPAGATALLDGENIGTSPLTHGDIQPGTHALDVSLAEYVPLQRRFDIAQGMHDTLSLTLMSQDMADSLRHARRKNWQMLRRISFGVLAVGFTGLGYYVDRKVHDYIDDEDAALANYRRSGLTQSQYDTYWASYEEAVDKTDSTVRRRNVLYGIAAGCAIGFGISIPF